MACTGLAKRRCGDGEKSDTARHSLGIARGRAGTRKYKLSLSRKQFCFMEEGATWATSAAAGDHGEYGIARCGDGGQSCGQPGWKFGWTSQASPPCAGPAGAPARRSALPLAGAHGHGAQASRGGGSRRRRGRGGGGRLRQPLPAKDSVEGGEGAVLLPSLSPDGLRHLLGLAAGVPAAATAAETSSVLGRI